jgi:hypothetical protein
MRPITITQFQADRDEIMPRWDATTGSGGPLP